MKNKSIVILVVLSEADRTRKLCLIASHNYLDMDRVVALTPISAMARLMVT